jgi:hypothetical protein
LRRRISVKRLRKIAAAPERTAGEVWATISDLLADTLERSEEIERAEVERAMKAAGGVGRQLISGGHLRKNPLVLVAGEMWLEIEVLSGNGAVGLEENLNPVPGGGSASQWTLYLPPVEPLAKLVRAAVKEDEHLSAEEPKAQVEARSSSKAAAFDAAALAAWAGERN